MKKIKKNKKKSMRKNEKGSGKKAENKVTTSEKPGARMTIHFDQT